MKKTVVFLLTVLLSLSACFTVPVSAGIIDNGPPPKPSEEYTYSVANGEVSLVYQCSYSAVFEIPETVKGFPVTKVEFGSAFVDDFAKVIYIPKTVRDVGNAINYGNRGLQAIVVDEENPYYSSVDGVLYNKEKTVMLKYPAAKKGPVILESTVTEIGDAAFVSCLGISDVVLQEGIKVIAESAFTSSNITSIVFPESLVTIGNYAFDHTGITSVTIPKGVQTIGVMAFGNCAKLNTVTFAEGITHIKQGAFWNCEKLSSVILPKSLVEIGTEAFGFIDYSSYDCLYWKANPDFTIYGWKNTAASQYAGWVEPEKAEEGKEPPPWMPGLFHFVPLDYFTDTENPPLAGDMSANGAVDAEDALIVLKNVVGKQPFHSSQVPVADFDGDGAVSAKDALAILKRIVGKESE